MTAQKKPTRPVHGTDVGETQEIEGFRFALAAALAICRREASELNEELGSVILFAFCVRVWQVLALGTSLVQP